MINISNLNARKKRHLVRERMRKEEQEKRLRTEDIGVGSFLRNDDGDDIAIGTKNVCERERDMEGVVE